MRVTRPAAGSPAAWTRAVKDVTPRPIPPPAPARAIGTLTRDGRADPLAVARAVALARRSDARLSDVLLAHGVASADELLQAEALRWGTSAVDLAEQPPDPRLLPGLDAAALLQAGCVPWRRVAGVTIFASARPERFERFAQALPRGMGACRMVVAQHAAVCAAIERMGQAPLTLRAEAWTDATDSCRAMHPERSAPVIGAAVGALLLWGLIAPAALLAALSAWAVATLAAVTGLRVLAALLRLRPRPPEVAREPAMARLPVVSVLVPLLREEAIAARLMRRLRRVDYPRELLDVCLVVEEDDAVTRRTLEETVLPSCARVIIVPDGSVRTKPRAMNYALPHCRGSIIGVWDAEDMPAPDQIRQVVRRFAGRGPEVACLQGRLDHYNARHNWIARCFAIEYNTWFRVFLPGLERMGLPVPLGGTTLFLRREAIEAVGGWDAHNVTEDADLGLRLARRGYRTEVIDTVTHEEANSRPVPWVRQRSRWLKGYALTWAVHMRDPGALWRDLGPRGFVGVQILFLGTVSQFALAPLLYLFLAAALGMPHPLEPVLGPDGLAALGAFFLGAQAVDLAVAASAVAGPRHRHLIPWAPLMMPYYAMATAAVWKALVEVAFRPFYWDKTAHGEFHDGEDGLTPAP